MTTPQLRKLVYDFFCDREELIDHCTETIKYTIDSASPYLNVSDNPESVYELDTRKHSLDEKDDTSQPKYVIEMTPDEFNEYREGLKTLVLLLYTPDTVAIQVFMPKTLACIRDLKVAHAERQTALKDTGTPTVVKKLWTAITTDIAAPKKNPHILQIVMGYLKNSLLLDLTSVSVQMNRITSTRCTRNSVNFVVDYGVPAGLIEHGEHVLQSGAANFTSAFLPAVLKRRIEDQFGEHVTDLEQTFHTRPLVAKLYNVYAAAPLPSTQDDEEFAACVRTWIHWLYYKLTTRDSRDDYPKDADNVRLANKIYHGHLLFVYSWQWVRQHPGSDACPSYRELRNRETAEARTADMLAYGIRTIAMEEEDTKRHKADIFQVARQFINQAVDGDVGTFLRQRSEIESGIERVAKAISSESSDSYHTLQAFRLVWPGYQRNANATHKGQALGLINALASILS